MNPPLAEIVSLLNRYRDQTRAVGGVRAADRFTGDPEVRAVIKWVNYMRRAKPNTEAKCPKVTKS